MLEREALTPKLRADPLTHRDLEEAALVGNGCSNKEIARELGMSVASVKRHIGHILAKLGLHDRLQLGIYIARNPLALTCQHWDSSAPSPGDPPRRPS
jgi:DNA-binding NarL/FixJ family response regulator